MDNATIHMSNRDMESDQQLERQEAMASSSSRLTGLPRQDDGQRPRRRRRRCPATSATAAMAALLLASGVIEPASASSVRRRTDAEASAVEQQLAEAEAQADELGKPSELHRDPATPPRQRRLRRQPNQRTNTNHDEVRALQGMTSIGGPGAPPMLPSNHPFLPSYADNTCTNFKEPQAWENGSPTLMECCNEYFGWAKEACPQKYGEMMTAKMADMEENGGKEIEPPRCGCGMWDWFCNEDCRKKKAAEAAANAPPVVYPYIPNKDEGTCFAKRDPKPWEDSYKNLKKCCGGHFRHVLKDCIAKGSSYEEAKETGVYWVANWGWQTCEKREKGNEGGYLSQRTCCSENFEWKLNECLGLPPQEDGGEVDLWSQHGQGQGDDTPDVSTGYPRTWWHPLWSGGHCTTNHEQAPPAYMSNDPENNMWKTYRECCEINFPDQWGGELDVCFDKSSVLAGPTRPPASANTVVQGADLRHYYWPVYAENRCELDGNDAPRSMRRDPTTYFENTAQKCCREHFPKKRKDCVRDSPRLPNDPDGTQAVGGGVMEEEVNRNQYKYHHFPSFGKVACVVNNHMDAPDYMYESPNDFFFDTVDACCSVSYEFEYSNCLKNTRLIELDLPLDDGYSDGAEEEREPSILINFVGKLYFRNVFLPHSSAKHMKIIRDVILNAVTVNLDRYKVAIMKGLSFDGVDVSNLEAMLDSRRMLRDDDSSANSQRRLARMLLFTFDLSISLPCDANCADNISYRGRGTSMDVTADFDDAIDDNLIYETITMDMEGMGLPGPFASATLPEGYLQYEGVEWDGRYTHPPTISPKPTEAPVGTPADPTPPPVQMEARNPFYPDHTAGTCFNDGRQSEFQLDLFDTLEDCCHFPWLEYYTCVIMGEAFTNKPTSRPTPNPTRPLDPTPPPTPYPTREPSPKPTRRPTPKPSELDLEFDSEWPTFSPTPQPSDSPTTATPTESPTERPTKNCQWHINTRTGDGCIDDDNIMDGWLNPNMKDRFLHPNANSCCATLFENRPCKIYDTKCGTVEPTVPGGDDSCGTDGWHVNTATNAGCTNDNNFPAGWMQANLMDKMFKATSKECCDEFFPGHDCPKVDVCGGDGGQADEPGPAPTPPAPTPAKEPDEPAGAGDCPGHGWHINTKSNVGCSNDSNFNPNWLNPNLKSRMFKATSEECCGEYFKNRPCPLVDGCGGGAPAPAPTPANDPPANEPSPENCGDHGWHVHLGNNDGCINDDNIVQGWLLSPAAQGRMFHATGDACCKEIFKGRPCKTYDDACAGPAPAPPPPPPPVPTPAKEPPPTEPPADEPPAATCGEHGWHIHRTNNDGCVDDDDYVKAWASNPSMKGKMFFPTRQACCDQFYSGKVCKEYESACGVPPPAPEPDAPPAPDTPPPVSSPPDTPPPVNPTPISSAETFSQDFEVSDLSETEFTTTNDLPWTITEEFASKGTKSIKNTKTERGQSSELRLSMDLPTNVLLSYEVRHDIFAPLATLQVKVDEALVGVISGHNGAPAWETREFPVTKGAHDVVWNVYTMDIEMPPIGRGSGYVWIDDVRTREILYQNFEDDEIGDEILFEDFGRWRITDNMPASKSGLSIHSPKGLLPGEKSTMKMNWNSPEGGTFSFMYHVGMGKVSCYVDGELKFSLDRPGQGTRKFETDIAAGDHVFTWTYEPPPHANMPMSHVWLDDIMAT